MTALPFLDAVAIAAAVRSGDASPVEVVTALMDHIRATERDVRAWECLDVEGAVTSARRQEREQRAGAPLGPLFGVPVGVKDIFDVEGMPTGANFRPFRKRIASRDAEAVGQVRQAGAIIIGKTVTVQFASGTRSPKTRNPWDPDRTPGGSSSGSAAAVAAGHVPLALGSQTGGSLLRPAAFCGIVGMKPSPGLVSNAGVIPVSRTFDTAGWVARSMRDIELVFNIVTSAGAGASNIRLRGELPPESRPRIGLIRELVSGADRPVRQAIEATANLLDAAGADVRLVGLPIAIEEALAAYDVIRGTEVAEVHSEQCREYPHFYDRQLRASVEVGQLIPGWITERARRLQVSLQSRIAALAQDFDALMSPTAATLPPRRREGTGDASFQILWSIAQLPTITLATGLSEEGLPHAIQLAGSPHEDRSLIEVASWVESLLTPLPQPTLANYGKPAAKAGVKC